MSEDKYELLGSAEKHVISQLEKAISDCRENALGIVEALKMAKTDNINEVMLDPGAREALIGSLPMIQQLADSLSTGRLIVALTAIALGNNLQ